MNPQLGRVVEIVAADFSRKTCAFAVAITLGFASSAMAAPEGGVFVTDQGGGFINQFGTVTNVGLPGDHPSNRHIIDWTSLNLASNETLNYFGLDGYRVLNRVSGEGATQINGMLNATAGHVYIVNAAGVIFGQNSIVNASSLHAAAASVTNDDFLMGDSLTFNVGVGEVEFRGTLNGTDHVSLIGNRVKNTGTINAGMVVMAIGNTIILKDLLNSRIAVEIDGSEMNSDYTAQAGMHEATVVPTDPGISNSGTVTASTGVTLAAGDMLGLAIQHSGEIHAEGGEVEFVAQGGAIWTRMDNIDVATPGLIDVGGTTAGTIDIIGTAIVHQGLARAIGDGGSIALRSYANTILRADGRLDTSGGAAFGGANAGDITVGSTNGTVWADQDTAIVATGGVWSGNGGNVTIDGDSLAFLPIVRQTAGNGEAGQLTIHSAGKTRVNTDTAPLPAVDFAMLSQSVIADGEFGRVGVGTGQTLSFVSSTLDLASTVILRFEASLQGLVGDATLASQDIQLAMGDFSKTIAAPNLKLIGGISMESDAKLFGDSSLTLTGSGVAGDGVSHLRLQSNEIASLQGDLGLADSKLGSLEISVGNELSLIASTVEVTQQSIHAAGDVTIGVNEQEPGSGATLVASDVIVMRAGGDLTIGLAGGGEFIANSSESFDFESAGNLSNHGVFVVDGNLRFSGAAVVNTGDLLAAGDIELIAASGLTLNSSGIESRDNNVSLRAGGDIVNNTPITASQGVVDIASTGGTITNAAAISGDAVILAAAGGLTVQSRVDATGDLTATTTNGTLSVDAVMNGADVTLGGGGGVQLHQEVAATKGMTIDSSAGNIMVAA
ncbi:MAG: filamentous hemagglutinin N-terminal domain-containing protein, partial [Phycisphaerales bacterium]|nr:filamentous hemagglutinin N-terminal domain-containing protein [Phycisphaerales bacterium]